MTSPGHDLCHITTIQFQTGLFTDLFAELLLRHAAINQAMPDFFRVVYSNFTVRRKNVLLSLDEHSKLYYNIGESTEYSTQYCLLYISIL